MADRSRSRRVDVADPNPLQVRVESVRFPQCGLLPNQPARKLEPMPRLVVLVAAAAVLVGCSSYDPDRLCADIAESRVHPSNALMSSILRNMPPEAAPEFSLADDFTEAYGLWREGDAYHSLGRDHLRRWGFAYLTEHCPQLDPTRRLPGGPTMPWCAYQLKIMRVLRAGPPLLGDKGKARALEGTANQLERLARDLGGFRDTDTAENVTAIADDLRATATDIGRSSEPFNHVVADVMKELIETLDAGSVHVSCPVAEPA